MHTVAHVLQVHGAVTMWESNVKACATMNAMKVNE
jgi:hypothetical protein